MVPQRRTGPYQQRLCHKEQQHRQGLQRQQETQQQEQDQRQQQHWQMAYVAQTCLVQEQWQLLSMVQAVVGL